MTDEKDKEKKFDFSDIEDVAPKNESKFDFSDIPDVPLKKKGLTTSPLKPSQVSGTLGTEKPKQPKPSVSSTSKVNGDLYSGYPSNKEKVYRLDNSTGVPVWYESTVSESGKKINKILEESKQKTPLQKAGVTFIPVEKYEKQINNPSRVAELNRFFKQDASTVGGEQVFTGYPGKEKNQYRIRDGAWERKVPGQKDWSELNNEASIKSLNERFGGDVKFKELKAKYSGAVIDNFKLAEEKLNKNLLAVNGNLIGQGQSQVVDDLQKRFPDFTFKKTGSFTDEMTITAPNNQTLNISLDNINSSDDAARALELKNWIKVNSNKELADVTKKLDILENKNQGTRYAKPGDPEYVKDSPYGQRLVPNTQETVLEKLGVENKIKAAEIKETRKEFAKQQARTFNDIQDEAINNNLSKEEVNARLAAIPHDKETSRRINEYSNDVLKIAKENNSKIEKLNAYSEDILNKVESGEITAEQYNSEYKPKLEADIKNINDQSKLLKGELSIISSVNKSLNESVAKNYLIQESKGTVLGGLARKAITGATYLPRLMSGGGFTAEDQKSLVNLIAGKGTTEEYTNSENRSDLTKVLFSLSESLSAMAAGGGLGGATAKAIGGAAGRLIGGAVPFYGQSYYMMKDEFDKIEGMTETEKVLMSGLYGVGASILEKFGMDAALGKTVLGKNITNSIMKSAFSSIPKDATKEMVEIAIKNSAIKLLTKAGLTAFGGSAAEFATEFSQAGLEASIKESYDSVKKTEFFNNKLGPDGKPINKTAWDITKGMLYEGYLGAIGGGIMNIASQSSSAIKNGLYKTYNEEQIQALITASNIDGINDSLLASLKTNILSGQINRDQAKEVLKSFGEIQSIAKSIPENLTDLQKSAALNLLIKKSAIQKEIEGKDKLLVKDEIEQISKIDQELSTIKNTENAIEESQQETTPIEGDTTEYQGVNEGQQKVGESQGIERNTAPNEANISDSNLPSQEEEVSNNNEEQRQNRRTDLFPEVTNFGRSIGRAKNDSNLSSYNEVNGIGFAEYTNPQTGLVDVIMTGKSDSDFIGYIRVYENGKPTNRFTSKMENKSGNKTDFKNMLTEAQKRLPENHEYTESTSISTDGLRIYEQQLNYGYDYALDENGNKITNSVAINGDSKQNILGINIDLGNFDDISVKNNSDFDLVKKALIPFMEKLGMNESNIHWQNGTVKIDLPVLRKKSAKQEVNVEAEQQQQQEQQTTFEDIKDLDLKDETNLKKAQSFLDNAIKDLDNFGKETLGMNLSVAVAKVVLKTVKALLDASVSLQEAIKQAAKKHDVQEVDIADTITAIENKRKKTEASQAAKDISKKPVTKITVDEAKALKAQIRLEAKAAAKGGEYVVNSIKEITKHFNSLLDKNKLSRKDLVKVINLISKVKDSETLNNAIPKLFDIVDNANPNIIEVNEAAALKNQIRAEVKAAAEGYKAAKAEGKAKAKLLKENRNNLRESVKSILKVGKISSKKVGYMMDRFGTVNVNSPIAVDKYLKYLEKIFDNANYEVNLSESLNIRKKIRAALESGVSKDIQADVKIMAKSFLDINPISLDSFVEYNNIATEVLNSVKRFEGSGRIAPPIKEINNYVEEIKSEQEKNEKIDKLAQYDNLVELGIIDKSMSLEEMDGIISSIEATQNSENPVQVAKEKLDKIKVYISNLFNGYSDTISHLLEQDNEYTDRQIEVMSRVLDLDIDKVIDAKETTNVKDAYRLVEAMDNFIQNGIISGLEAKVNAVEGYVALDEISNDKTLSQGRTDMIQRARLDQLASLDVLFHELFGGVRGALKVQKAFGINLFSKGVNTATKTHNKIVDDYVSTFKKKKPNNENFHTNDNDYERGLIAYLKRNVFGSDIKKQKEFRRRVEIFLQSVKDLKEKGSEQEIQMSEDYSKLLDKFDLNNPNTSIDDILSKADPINVEAVDWWIDNWGEDWNELSDVSKSVNNLILTKEENYTTDTYTSLDENKTTPSQEQLDRIGSFQTALGISTETSGPTMERNPNLKKLDRRYLNLSFDNNQSRARKAALLDIHTAAVSHKMNAALRNETALRKLIPNVELRKIVTDRIIAYQRAEKSKTIESDKTLKDFVKFGQKLGSYGAMKVLGAANQAIKQSVSPISSTVVNTGSFNVVTALSKSANKFLNESGMAIANRGKEASTFVENLDKRLNHYEKIYKSDPLKFLAASNELYLKTFLVKTDIIVARASWLAYYEKELGYKPDYENHKQNQDAADYAQYMVNINQNISETAKGGKFLASKEPAKQIVKQTTFTFAVFSINQKNRMAADWKIANSKTASEESKNAAKRSLVALSVEVVTFNLAKVGIGIGLTYAAYGIMGIEEPPEETAKRLAKQVSYAISGGIKDLFAPIPPLESLTIKGFNFIADKVQDLFISQSDIDNAVNKKNNALKEGRKEPMDAIDKKNFIKKYIADQKMIFTNYESKPELGLDLGSAGIIFDQGGKLIDLSTAATTGIITEEYDGKITEKYISEEDSKWIVRALIEKSIFLTIGLPKEVDDVTNLILKVVSKRSMNERQNEKYLEIKKLNKGKEISKIQDFIIHTSTNLESSLDELEKIEEKGGLTDEQTKVYIQVRNRLQDGYLSGPNIDRIKEGATADYIVNKKYRE